MVKAKAVSTSFLVPRPHGMVPQFPQNQILGFYCCSKSGVQTKVREGCVAHSVPANEIHEANRCCSKEYRNMFVQTRISKKLGHTPVATKNTLRFGQATPYHHHRHLGIKENVRIQQDASMISKPFQAVPNCFSAGSPGGGGGEGSFSCPS